MTDLSGLQPRLGLKILTMRKGGGPRALHPGLTFAPVALAGVLLAGSLAQTGLALLRDTAQRSLLDAEWLTQSIEPAQRDLPESRIRLKKLDDAAAAQSERQTSAIAQNHAH
jgi:hypothetical protein